MTVFLHNTAQVSNLQSTPLLRVNVGIQPHQTTLKGFRHQYTLHVHCAITSSRLGEGDHSASKRIHSPPGDRNRSKTRQVTGLPAGRFAVHLLSHTKVTDTTVHFHYSYLDDTSHHNTYSPAWHSTEHRSNSVFARSPRQPLRCHINSSHMSEAQQELCNGIICLKCATLQGTKFCAERAQAPGTTYQALQELMPEYEEDIKRRFANIPPKVVTKLPSTMTTSSTTTAPVFRVEGFPGFSDHVTAPPREVLLWSVEDSDVRQEYVVDQSSGRLFEKAPIYKNPASQTSDSDTASPTPLLTLPDDQKPTPSANDLISALSSPDNDSQNKEEPNTLLTSIREGSRAETSSQQEPPLQTTRSLTIPDLCTSTTTGAPSSNHTSLSTHVISTEWNDPVVVEVTEVARVTESSDQSPRPAPSTEPTSKSSNSTSPGPSQLPRPVSNEEGSGLSPEDIKQGRSVTKPENTTTPHTLTPADPIPEDTSDNRPPGDQKSTPRPATMPVFRDPATDDSTSTGSTNSSETTVEHPSPSNTTPDRSSGGFLSGLLGAPGSVVTGVLSVKDSLIDTATAGVSAGISGILQGASGLGTLAKAKSGKAGKKKSRPKIQARPNQTKTHITDSVHQAKPNPQQQQTKSSVGHSQVLLTTTRTTKRTTKHTIRRPGQATKSKSVSKKPVDTRGRSTPKAKTVRPPKTTAKPSQRKALQPATEDTRNPTPADNNQPEWASGGFDQIADVFTNFTERRLEDALAPSNQNPAPANYPNYDYLDHDGEDGSGLSQGDREETFEHTRSFPSREPSQKDPIQPSTPNKTPRVISKNKHFTKTKMSQVKSGKTAPGTRGCGQKVGCSEWGLFKEDTLEPFIQLLTTSDSQGLGVFPDDESGSGLFSKEGLKSFSKSLDSHDQRAPMELNAGIRMLLKFSLATLAQTRMARIDSQDQSELSQWTDLGLTLPGLFLGLFYFLYLVRQLHAQWKANAEQKERQRELDRDARMLRNLQASRRRPVHDRALEMPLRNRRDFDVEAQPDYE